MSETKNLKLNFICFLCESKHYKQRPGRVRDNKALKVFECCKCGLVFLSQNSHINNSFYEDSGMHKKFEFKEWRYNSLIDDSRRFEFVKNMILNKEVLDFGSGNGQFLKRAKDICKKAVGVEIENALLPYYKKENLMLYKSLKDINDKFDIITSFHVLEHIKKPLSILNRLKSILKNDGKLIIEVPNSNDALLTIYKNKAFSFFTYWSCHLFLYNFHTLSLLAKKASLKVEFIKHIQRYPLSNHLYWLAKNKPSGHEKWGHFIDSLELNRAYESQLASLQATDTIIACLSKDK